MIFTFVYAAPHDDAFVENTLRVVGGHGGQVLFVRLTCDPAVSDERIGAPERRAYGKATSVERALDAEECARWIAARFSLP